MRHSAPLDLIAIEAKQTTKAGLPTGTGLFNKLSKSYCRIMRKAIALPLRFQANKALKTYLFFRCLRQVKTYNTGAFPLKSINFDNSSSTGFVLSAN
jgi:hypothetical protein